MQQEDAEYIMDSFELLESFLLSIDYSWRIHAKTFHNIL